MWEYEVMEVLRSVGQWSAGTSQLEETSIHAAYQQSTDLIFLIQIYMKMKCSQGKYMQRCLFPKQ